MLGGSHEILNDVTQIGDTFVILVTVGRSVNVLDTYVRMHHIHMYMHMYLCYKINVRLHTFQYYKICGFKD